MGGKKFCHKVVEPRGVRPGRFGGRGWRGIGTGADVVIICPTAHVIRIPFVEGVP